MAFSFHDALGDYGYWTYATELGREVWVPYVDYGWRPYQYGHWVYSPYGWTWVAYEPWGWLPHHYGNWVYVDFYGWVWIPGYEYSPARVNWAVTDGYFGWSPMPPPGYTYRHNRDYRYRGGRDWYRSGWREEPPYSGADFNLWVFVDNRHFYNQNIARYALPPGRGAEFFRRGMAMPVGETLDVDYVRRRHGSHFESVPEDRRVYRVDGNEVISYQPRGQEARVRQAALETVNEALAPGFKRHGVPFKGNRAKNAPVVNQFFGQEKRAPAT